MKVPPPIRRHVFRDAKCARQDFHAAVVRPTAGRMQVYYESVDRRPWDGRVCTRQHMDIANQAGMSK